MSDLLKAWYLFLALALLTFVLSAFVGSPPYLLSSLIAAPHDLLYRTSHNLRGTTLSVIDRREYRAEIASLREQVDVLRSENRQLEVTLERYKEALRVREFQSPGVVGTAPVVGVDPSPLLSRITLGEGWADGVARNMPVTTPAGLVGIVTEVRENRAIVRTITDPESRVGVTVQTRGGQGSAVGDNGGFVRVINYYENEPVEVGDLVETSSRGGLFPRGILVGEVVQVYPKDPNNLRSEFLVRPAAEIQNLLEVALIEPL